MKKITVRMPSITNNDDKVTLECWCVEKGSFVKKGQLLAVLETTKETMDLIAEDEGYISFCILEGTEVPVGEMIAVIQDEPIEKEEISNKKEAAHQISKRAMELIEEYQIDIACFPKDRIIKEKDVLKMISQNGQKRQSTANEILIICGGYMARMCIDTLRQMGGYRLGGITDMYAKPGKELMGVPYIGDIQILADKYREGYRTAVNAYGGLGGANSDELLYTRKRLYEEIKSYQFFLPNLIHPKATIESSATMGEGNLIFSGAYIGSEAYIGNDCIINTGAVISHNCVIEDHARISPGAMIAGNVSIGENSIIGMGVTVYMKVKIGKNVIVYNGKHIFNDVPDNTIVK